MTSRDFCYWLQGYFEISKVRDMTKDESPILTDQQIITVKQHLAMVFRHEIDPSFGKDLKDLVKIHDSGLLPGTGPAKFNC